VIVKELVAGGSPTFGIHAAQTDRICSPGTTVLWDFGYGDTLPDLPFLPAAVLLARVISKPGKNRITLDLGHKSVAPENPHPRVRFEELPDATPLMQSEEHLVLETERAHEFLIGQALHGIPRHVCPTVSMHGEAVVIENGSATTRWPITARNRKITI
jgi:D-serine deaminase-like pyridoxal phosphate-dependent protein